MLIFFTGFMGSGKTTIGKSVATELNIPFLDLDEYLEKENGKTISKMFREEGESSFRIKEFTALDAVIKNHYGQDAIIALGGGTLSNKKAAEIILKNGVCVHLKKEWSETLEVLKNIDGRPLLKELSSTELELLFNERQKYYSMSQLETPINTSFSPKKLVNLLKLLTNR